MEISLLADTVTLPSIQTLAYTNSSNLTLQISASLCPPPVKSALKTLPRREVRKKRRTRRISLTAGGGSGYDDLEDGAEIPAGADGGYGDSGGSFRWGGGAGGGRGNSDGLGWSENEESKDWPFGSAFHAFYEVISWITLSNCLRFAVHKVLSGV